MCDVGVRVHADEAPSLRWIVKPSPLGPPPSPLSKVRSRLWRFFGLSQPTYCAFPLIEVKGEGGGGAGGWPEVCVCVWGGGGQGAGNPWFVFCAHGLRLLPLSPLYLPCLTCLAPASHLPPNPPASHLPPPPAAAAALGLWLEVVLQLLDPGSGLAQGPALSSVPLRAVCLVTVQVTSPDELGQVGTTHTHTHTQHA